jgi:HEPN domain-containing protein
LNRKELQALSRIRLREARALVKLGMHDGAYYLAGYCVECALKACIAKFTQRHDFPDKRKNASYTHVLRELVTAARLEKAHSEELKRDTAFRNYWDTVQSWSERSRYFTTSAEGARDLIEAVGNRKHGVLRWVKLHW